MSTGSADNAEQIATREKCSVRQVNMTISLAYLSPTLVKAAIDGRLPRGIGIARLCEAASFWEGNSMICRPQRTRHSAP
jgi:site-specific DNA recombinase